MVRLLFFYNLHSLRIKWLFVLAILVVIGMGKLKAQISLSGKVKDVQEKPVSYANILLLQSSDSALVVGAVSDEFGEFTMEVQKGDYLIKIAMVGYQPFFNTLVVDASIPEHLGTFTITEDAKELDEIVIKGKKPLFEKEVDRTVVNVQSSITSAGSTVLEVLEKSPGVIVNRQNNSIALNGNGGVLIMINGKISRMPTDAIVQMLNGMSSANIEKIELITTPQAKYDAEGNAGIIHLVLSENPDKGTNGNAGITGGYNSGETWGANGSINHRGLQFSTFINYSILSDRTENIWENNRFEQKGDFTSSMINVNNRNPITIVQNLQAGLGFDISDRTEINFLLTGYTRKWDTSDRISSVNTTTPDSVLETNSNINEINLWQSATASLGVNHQLSEGQKIDISFDYLYYHQRQPSDYAQEIFFNDAYIDQELIEVDKKTPIHFEVGSIDYSNHIGKNLFFEAGIKGSMSQFTNNVLTERSKNGIQVIDPFFTNNSRLDESILAAYASTKWEPDTLWSLQFGLRYEFTDTYMGTLEEEALVDREYGNFFPTISATRKLTEDSKLHLTANRRITRPTYNDLAPYVFFINPTMLISGNLNLLPAINNSIDLSYQLKQWWVSVKYNYVENAIAPFQPRIDQETNLQVLSSQNLAYQRSYGIHTALPIGITDWWEFRNDLSLNYFQYKSQHLSTNVVNDLLSFTYNGTHTFQLPKDFSLEVTSYFQSASNWGLIHLKPLGRLDVGLKKQLKNNGGSLSLIGTDLLNTTAWRGNIQVPNPNVEGLFSYNFGMRGVRITYSKNFGNKKLKQVNIKSGSEEEQKRIN